MGFREKGGWKMTDKDKNFGNLQVREGMFEVRKNAIKEHLDMLIQKTELQAMELKLFRKSLEEKETDYLTTLDFVTEYVENTDWHLTRAINLTRDYLNAKRLLEEEQNKLSKGEI